MTKLRFEHGICLFPLGQKSGGNREKTRQSPLRATGKGPMKEPVGVQEEDSS